MINDFKRRRAATRTPQIPKEEPLQPIHSISESIPVTPTPKKPRKFHIWPRKWSTKKKRICTGILVAVLVIAIGVGGFFFWKSRQAKPTQEQQVAQQEAPKPTTEASTLTGVQVPIATNQRGVIGIMIENSPDARPQSGLKEAGVVYEAVAEGGITRFLALYQEATPDYIGPVRSARPYFVEWLAPYLASYAHVGGSPEALALIKSLGIRDLDQFYNPSAYKRVSNRYAPHNVYTSVGALYQLAEQKGFIDSKFTGFVRKAAAPVTPSTSNSIDLAMSGPLYNVHYDYDPATQTYKRFLAGKSHVDERSGAQLSPNVVIAMVMPSTIAADRIHTVYQTTGTGTMYVFQDGVVTPGNWQKTDAKSQFVFTDQTGKPLALNPGQTWLTMVKDAGSVVYR